MPSVERVLKFLITRVMLPKSVRTEGASEAPMEIMSDLSGPVAPDPSPYDTTNWQTSALQVQGLPCVQAWHCVQSVELQLTSWLVEPGVYGALA